MCRASLSCVSLIGVLGLMGVQGVPSKEYPCQECGLPLLLTPLIQAGKIEQAQNLSEVHGDIFLDVRSHAAFLTVDEERGSNSFFWYFPAETTPETAPVLLWLQGGPGLSSLYGLFVENGPLLYKNNSLERNPFSWSASHHMLYIDNPVGAGFSYTTSGYARNQTRVGRDLREAILQFFRLFPDLKKNDFFVAGESYAGKYVPALCRALHESNNNSTEHINLKGFAIGNGLSDPLHQLDHASFLYQLGFIDKQGINILLDLQQNVISHIEAARWNHATYALKDYLTYIRDEIGINNMYNYIKLDASESFDEFSILFESEEFRRAIHVGDVKFGSDYQDVHNELVEDLPQSVSSWLGSLFDSYRGLVYSGQLDVVVAYPLTENMLAHLEFSSAAQYATASRHMWRVDGQIAGYAKVAGNLTELLVRNAGHMVPMDQPAWALDMITRFTRDKPFF